MENLKAILLFITLGVLGTQVSCRGPSLLYMENPGRCHMTGFPIKGKLNYNNQDMIGISGPSGQNPQDVLKKSGTSYILDANEETTFNMTVQSDLIGIKSDYVVRKCCFKVQYVQSLTILLFFPGNDSPVDFHRYVFDLSGWTKICWSRPYGPVSKVSLSFLVPAMINGNQVTNGEVKGLKMEYCLAPEGTVL